jgi:glycosyl transferase family 25
MFKEIEKVVYINLEERVDRKQNIEKELLQYFPAEKIQRFNAIKYESHGGIGCTKSHIAVLEMAIQERWKNVLIVEDDAIWANFHDSYIHYKEQIKKQYDVILLSGGDIKYTSDYKIISAQTTTSYIVANHYYERLLNNFKESFNGFISTYNYPKYALDQYWKILQKTDNWYCVVPCIMVQMPGYSDIEKKYSDYTSMFYNIKKL